MKHRKPKIILDLEDEKLLLELHQLFKDLQILSTIGQMYLDAVEEDPELEFVSGTQVLMLTEVRDAIGRAKALYDE